MITILLLAVCLLSYCSQIHSFSIQTSQSRTYRAITSSLGSSFMADGSEYSTKDDFEDDEDGSKQTYAVGMREEDETPTVELKPPPLSRNAGNRFVAVVWDRDVSDLDDPMDRHEHRITLTEDHVLYCRKSNLYNETHNSDSKVDVLWSLPVLASDLQRVIGHAMCLESRKLDHAQEFLRNEPIIQSLTGGDLSNIPLFRWRHIRDSSLRIDDGRDGYPCLCLAMDAASKTSQKIRDQVKEDYLEYLIRSERVIAAGPLHVPTVTKDDAESLAVGDLILFNAQDRDDAIAFVESTPSAENGLYDDMRTYFYNTWDVTGKFVSEDPLRDAPGAEMQEALEAWGYPTRDDETPWLNF